MPTINVYNGLLNYQLLEQYDTETGLATGVYKPNIINDPDYVAPSISDQCPVRFTKWIGSDKTSYCEQRKLTWDSLFFRFDSTEQTFDNQ